jgi:hypothetical protein
MSEHTPIPSQHEEVNNALQTPQLALDLTLSQQHDVSNAQGTDVLQPAAATHTHARTVGESPLMGDDDMHDVAPDRHQMKRHGSGTLKGLGTKTPLSKRSGSPKTLRTSSLPPLAPTAAQHIMNLTPIRTPMHPATTGMDPDSTAQLSPGTEVVAREFARQVDSVINMQDLAKQQLDFMQMVQQQFEQLNKNIESTMRNVVESVVDPKLEQVNSKLDAVQATMDEMEKDVSSVRTEVSHLQQSREELKVFQQDTNTKLSNISSQLRTAETNISAAQQATHNAAQEMAWCKQTLSIQLKAALQPLIDPIKLDITLKPVGRDDQDFTSFGRTFGRLNDAGIAQKLMLPPSAACQILLRQPARRPGQQEYNAGDPCASITVRMHNLPTKYTVLSKASKDHLKATYNVVVHDVLLPQERKDKAHLQEHAMEHMRQLGIHATWRRSAITWYVRERNGFALLHAGEIIPNATLDQVKVAVATAVGNVKSPAPPATGSDATHPPGTSTNPTSNMARAGPSIMDHDSARQ